MTLQRNFSLRDTFFACLLALAFFFCFSTSAHAEIIKSFDASVTVHKDGSLTVSETIRYDFGDEQRHGIFRTIPRTHPEPASIWHQERYVDIEVTNVVRNAFLEPYTIEEGRDMFTVQIGDPSRVITGEHTYLIEYTVRGALFYPKTTDPEIYWNVTGNDWPVPILSAKATLRDPDGLLLSSRTCYQGIEGLQASCTIIASTTSVAFSSTNILPKQGMTFAHSLATAKVEKLILERTKGFFFVALFGLMALGGILLLAFSVYRYRTKHKPSSTIVAQYEPLPDIPPMYTGVLIDGKLDPRDITAGIVALAEQGVIRISHTSRKVLYLFEVEDYEVTYTRALGENAVAFSRELISLLFGNQQEGARVALGDLAKDTTRQKANRALLQTLEKEVVQDLAGKGYYELIAETAKERFKKLKVYWPLVALCVVIILIAGKLTAVALLILVPVLLIVIPLMLKRLTRKGYDAVNHLKGYKLYLSVAEKDRIDFHNAPQKSPEEFLKHLPYAIAFGVEEKWAEAFKDVVIPTPDWYDGGPNGSFSAITLGNSLGAFSTSLSSSSGASASSGGGSSGGGAGGGGGGSW